MCEARPGTPLNVALWSIRKISVPAAGESLVEHAGGVDEFRHLATDLATVKALTFS
jgi:hypothetical protein